MKKLYRYVYDDNLDKIEKFKIKCKKKALYDFIKEADRTNNLDFNTITIEDELDINNPDNLFIYYVDIIGSNSI